MTSPVPLVEVVRSGLREGLHHGSAVVVDPQGGPLLSLGSTTAPMYPRSSLKPAQATAMLRCGLDLPSADLALAASSHSGEQDHVRRVAALLERFSLTEDDLRCPPDLPMDETARRGASVERRITMNCSGKHAAMLATCVINGWSTADHLDPKHPLQVAIADTVVELAGEPLAGTGVDGCGAPLFAISLTGLARVFQRVVGTPVGAAMREHPWLVAGTDRQDTYLMAAVPGLISKIGAEGVFAFALPDGRAAAIKVADGAGRPRLPIAVGLLDRLGITGLEHLAEEPVLGGGRPVGSVRLIPGALG
ncbi:asparaginase [Saccharopolyspora rhizosphaerae]|uniref:Asparaginase n=1 Tax=Saccharopolyspora rhizosphaerae TaxID=2492662 RepID=A0A426JJ20_9PSEU|nr:asparaginase [Saccharopolyspora rhizosphaerae]RRO13174.1 asparaginase [Saccharopolyspora rhizosphaerae]